MLLSFVSLFCRFIFFSLPPFSSLIIPEYYHLFCEFCHLDCILFAV
ncbi:hypothetical protein ES319_D05G391300v1 [Gossypium barbadense]|uniref:Uncharacterized protein n=1 Tax=Gossypium barbadense TaxID=3634 RepID=A0A5J5RMW0_GOSBA|nr:hypothetical protein ES319_D05G391300v1 [Gossypium barbadense]